ncbi:MAG: hypothetical protein OP8BY_0028 [Candidatus Saccharicenans subterraneus]|uniref:Uncharacterized protein n=1 Tax=Candidatus Saccharicenans subterraneus TaxID=2508984 RepID=A0A3E2BLN2_9BACT|nr:MAG: hypothetical protein OP8BY_0028 [Candidatus Saccharicenans subterraneum]
MSGPGFKNPWSRPSDTGQNKGNKENMPHTYSRYGYTLAPAIKKLR